MRNPEQVLNMLSAHSANLSYKFERLYRIMFNEEMFYIAYQRIYAKQGNMTPGTDGQTIDQMSIQRIANIIQSLKDESYCPKPAKRVYIPKKNGKLRPLGIPTIDDKLVQEVTRMILEAIYEGHFEPTSHGFRPSRSCHTALISLQKTCRGVTWFIEGDIKGFFDNINHNTLIAILSERIADERFLRLIRKFLNAGYLEKWEYHKTYSGTPQGGIISPILANIYLDKFDKYIKEYTANFDRGRCNKPSKEYVSIANKLTRIRKKIMKEDDLTKKADLIREYQTAREIEIRTPRSLNMDDSYRRMKYVRYADDFLIGVSASKEDCERIKADMTAFMADKLQLELSAEKTLITHSSEVAKFLGFEVSVRKTDATKRNKDGKKCRSFSGQVVLNVNSDVARKKLEQYGAISISVADGKHIWKPKARKELIGRNPEDILALINQEIMGFRYYYSIANNIASVGNSFAYMMEYSLYKTLGQKLRCSVGAIKDKYRQDKDFVIPYKDKRGNTKYRVLYNGSNARQKRGYMDYYVDIIPSTQYIPYPTLIERLKLGVCELCGKEDKLIMHQVRNLYALKPNTEWNKAMLKLRRKTLAVCHSCNERIRNYGK